MKLFGWFLALSMIIGTAVFILSQQVKFKPWVRPGQEKEYRLVMDTMKPTAPSVDSNLPSIECLEDNFDFGVMLPYEEGQQTFVIRNVGTAPLVLLGGKTTCKCTETDVRPSQIPPGETHEITLSWFTRPDDQFFRQSAVINTNDPKNRQLVLSVTGQVRTSLASTAESISFDALLPGSEQEAAFSLYSEIWSLFNVVRIESTSEQLSCREIDPLSLPDAGKRAIFSKSFSVTARAADVFGKHSGTVRVFVQPPDDTKLELAGLEQQADGTVMVEVPIYVAAIRRFSLYGPSIRDTEKRLIDLGTIPPSKSSIGKRWVIVGILRGDLAPESVNATIEGIPGLEVTVQKVDQKSDASTSYRFVFEIKSLPALGIYKDKTEGRFRIDLPGLPGEEEISFSVNLDVPKF